MDEVALSIEKNLDYVSLAVAFARKVCVGMDHPSVDEDFVNAVELAMSEACTNAIVHDRGNGNSEEILISLEVWNDKIVMNIKDRGAGFDITAVPPPGLPKRSAGGYGIHIIRSLMDDVRYFRLDEWNVLSMTKFFGYT